MKVYVKIHFVILTNYMYTLFFTLAELKSCRSFNISGCFYSKTKVCYILYKKKKHYTNNKDKINFIFHIVIMLIICNVIIIIMLIILIKIIFSSDFWCRQQEYEMTISFQRIVGIVFARQQCKHCFEIMNIYLNVHYSQFFYFNRKE